MAAGFYQDLEALQGRRRTRRTGKMFALSAVEPVVADSRAMVAQHVAGA